jgi:hypothetical protein
MKGNWREYQDSFGTGFVAFSQDGLFWWILPDPGNVIFDGLKFSTVVGAVWNATGWQVTPDTGMAWAAIFTGPVVATKGNLGTPPFSPFDEITRP